MEEVYILFYMDDEYGHFDIKGVFDSMPKLISQGLDKIQEKENEVNIRIYGVPYAEIGLFDYDKEKSELSPMTAMCGDRLFWKKIKLNNLIG